MDRITEMNEFEQNPETQENISDNVTGDVSEHVSGNFDEVSGNQSDGFYVDNDGHVISDEPCSRAKLAQKLGISKSAINKLAQKLKKYHLENDLLFDGKLTTFAQKEIQFYRSMKLNDYEKKNPPLETSDQDETGGSIQLHQPESNKPSFPKVDVLPSESWDCEKIANTFSRTQSAIHNGQNALQRALNGKANSQDKWQTFQEAELREYQAKGFEQGANKARAYIEAEEAAFQRFMQEMGKFSNNGGSQSQSE
jgi:transcriptional regulator with XRE-family HTH domain